jgi:hypothetical protein
MMQQPNQKNGASPTAKGIDAEAREELNLSPFVLESVPLTQGVLKLKNKLPLQPTLSESGELLELEHKALQIDVFAPTRELLWQELMEQLRMLWQEYAEAPIEELSPPAQELRAKLRAAMEVVSHGARSARD